MAGYRIPHQQAGVRVSWWADPRGPDHGTHVWGTIVEHLGDTVFIVWDDDTDFYETWDAREMRYRIDRGQMRLRQLPKQRRVRLPSDQVCCKICGKPRQLRCGCPRPGAVKPEEWGQKVVRPLLTPSTGRDMMVISNRGNAPDDDTHEVKGAMMARKKAEVIDEVEELEELDEVGEDASDSGETLTAKQAASLLKTDGRTLRKFLRKKHGTVGQGQRWEISAGDIEALRIEFAAFTKGTKDKATDKAAAPKATKDKAKAKPKEVEVEADADDDLDNLEEIDDLDFDD